MSVGQDNRWWGAWRAVRALALAAVFAGAARVATGRVFLREDGGVAFRRSLEQLGGQAVYEAEMTINGGRGDVTVLGFGDSLRRVFARVGRLYRDAALNYEGGGLGLMELADAGGVTRVLGVDTGGDGRCVMIVLRQSGEEARRSRIPPERVEMGGVSVSEAMDVSFFAADRHTGLSFAAGGARVGGGAAAVAAFRSAGWRAVVGEPAGGEPQGGACFLLRGQELCVVTAIPGEDGGAGTIAVLHKPQRFE